MTTSRFLTQVMGSFVAICMVIAVIGQGFCLWLGVHNPIGPIVTSVVAITSVCVWARWWWKSLDD